MKKFLFLITAVCFFISGQESFAAAKAAPAKAPAKVYKVGDKGPAGGWIFYDKGSVADGWRYLEAAPVDQSFSAEWGSAGVSIPGANGTAIGTGKANTLAIVKNTKQAGIAAKLCTAYRGGGKKDWFMPSKDELNALFYSTAGIKCNFKPGDVFYWSSSEVSADRVCSYFTKGQWSTAGKNQKDQTVRAIRAF